MAAAAVAEELAHAQASAEAETTRANDLEAAQRDAQSQVEELTARATKAEAEVARLEEDGTNMDADDDDDDGCNFRDEKKKHSFCSPFLCTSLNTHTPAQKSVCSCFLT